jgi:hypothetical protein
MSEVLFATTSSRARLAYRYDNAKASGPGIFWLSGFKSDMAGTKAEAVAAAARASGRPCLRFDYSGHGRSEGNFAELTISDWLNDALAMFLEIARGEQIVVGCNRLFAASKFTEHDALIVKCFCDLVAQRRLSSGAETGQHLVVGMRERVLGVEAVGGWGSRRPLRPRPRGRGGGGGV